MEEKQPVFRILMFPWLAHGHVFPFLELAKKLSTRNFRVYFCSTAINFNSMKNSPNFDHTSIQFVELNLPSLPNLPPQYHTTKNIRPDLMPTLMEAFQMSSSVFSNILTDLNPDLLIYDGFQPWAAKSAISQGIPAVHFATSSATTFSFFHHMHTYHGKVEFPYPDIYVRGYEWKNMQAEGRSIKVKDADSDFIYGIFKLSCDVVLIKSCKGIEGKYIDLLSDLCDRKVVPVGPLITFADSVEDGNSEIMEWLSKKNEFSTVYISFGSENYLSKDQIEEIAKGLEISNVNFIWVVRFPAGQAVSIENVFPEGFLDKSKEKGKIVQGWAPQANILAHQSIGGFLSHCGWSSVTESVYFGVPVIAMPMKLDQPINGRLVVEAGCGVEVVRDEKGQFGGEEVAKAINQVIVEKSGEGLRLKARELSKNMQMEQEQAVDEAAEHLRSLCGKKGTLSKFRPLPN